MRSLPSLKKSKSYISVLIIINSLLFCLFPWNAGSKTKRSLSLNNMDPDRSSVSVGEEPDYSFEEFDNNGEDDEDDGGDDEGGSGSGSGGKYQCLRTRYFCCKNQVLDCIKISHEFKTFVRQFNFRSP